MVRVIFNCLGDNGRILLVLLFILNDKKMEDFII